LVKPAKLSPSPVGAVRTRRAYFDLKFGQLHVRTAFPATGGFDPVGVIGAAVDAAVELAGPGRILGAHVDHAAEGAAAVERALRAAQQLDGVDVVEIAEIAHAALGLERHAIEVEADRRPAARRLLLRPHRQREDRNSWRFRNILRAFAR